jgi:hypothetical protein
MKSFYKAYHGIRNTRTKLQIRAEIMTRCGISESKFYNLLAGHIEPDINQATHITDSFAIFGIYEVWE